MHFKNIFVPSLETEESRAVRLPVGISSFYSGSFMKWLSYIKKKDLWRLFII
jgi:hypothetical protein